MSYYTSSTLLDYGNTTGYGGVGGGSTTSASRYDSLFGSSLTGGSTSAYRLVFYLFTILFWLLIKQTNIQKLRRGLILFKRGFFIRVKSKRLVLLNLFTIMFWQKTSWSHLYWWFWFHKRVSWSNHDVTKSLTWGRLLPWGRSQTTLTRFWRFDYLPFL